MNTIEKHLVAARKAVEDCLLKNGKVPKAYRSYVSSFGVDIRQSGVLPTLLLYRATDANTQEDRGKVVEAIGIMLNKTVLQLIEDAYAGHDNANRRTKLRREITDAAVTLKLAMRTFPFEDAALAESAPAPSA